jgi:methylmalonyl-CoA carboxyltransferase large subunit
MTTLLWMLASSAAGWFLGSRATQRQIDRRFAELETRLPANHGGAPPQVQEPRVTAALPAPAAREITAPQAEPEQLPEEVVLVISAAIAAYRGKRARIRTIRRVPAPGYNPWSQQGRVYIQGSHNIWTRHGE